MLLTVLLFQGNHIIYQHSYFRQGRPDLLRKIKRRGVGMAKDPLIHPLATAKVNKRSFESMDKETSPQKRQKISRIEKPFDIEDFWADEYKINRNGSGDRTSNLANIDVSGQEHQLLEIPPWQSTSALLDSSFLKGDCFQWSHEELDARKSPPPSQKCVDASVSINSLPLSPLNLPEASSFLDISF